MGPNSDDREVMKQLLLNGMDVARFDFSQVSLKLPCKMAVP